MKDIKLIHRAGPFGDETSLYVIDFESGTTVQDLIDFALAKKRDWGDIDIRNDISRTKPIYRLTYRYGKIESDNIPENIKQARIRRGSANGGWTFMAYMIEV